MTPSVINAKQGLALQFCSHQTHKGRELWFSFLINALCSLQFYTCRLLSCRKWSHSIDRFDPNSRLGCRYNVYHNHRFPKASWFCHIQKNRQWTEGHLQAFIKYWAEYLERSGVDSAHCSLMQCLSAGKVWQGQQKEQQSAATAASILPSRSTTAYFQPLILRH